MVKGSNLKQSSGGKKVSKKVAVPKDIALKNGAEQSEAESVSASEVSSGTSAEYESKALSRKERRKIKKQQKKQEVQEEVESEEDDEENQLDLDQLARSDSESEDEEEPVDGEEEEEEPVDGEEEEEEDDDEEDDDDDVPFSDVEFDSDADVVPHHKLTVNNSRAMKDALERIQVPWKKHSFQEHQAITSASFTDEGIKDIYDDTERELAFYKQALSAVVQARDKLKKLKVPFKRPLDYFAEMVKSDEHMDRLKMKLIKEASDKKAREDSKKQRQLKKFGKQVQVATLQQRQKEKRETLDKLKTLKKKRKHDQIDENDFEVGVEEATSEKKRKPNTKRLAKDSKYGFGGMKRYNRKNDAQSSSEMGDFSQRKMKGKPSRPGKSKRSRRH
ncbi:Ebp2p Ecym_8103 [Eremothecium cymbalariae DBVPG|uniref:rRNA-processing protein EBP2 n=1 Tax=Eremothecium cymbalariae (strain CBS 270.75 / DBVPG 7215 / KCTC 17166 / NRRL Y-17582) TaxID=931890 RepID=G8JX23_ERECY|nr:Hypothetical protein Ecym_8103 [Eremothecium cymbalariae DBVPG\